LSLTRKAKRQRPGMENAANSEEHELQRAFRKLESEIRDGLRHGFFEVFVSCEVIKDGKRRLIIRAGKSYVFVIPEEEVRVSKIA
jgi:hypothetical protein